MCALKGYFSFFGLCTLKGNLAIAKHASFNDVRPFQLNGSKIGTSISKLGLLKRYAALAKLGVVKIDLSFPKRATLKLASHR
jgi:hypothetical protein